MRKNEHIISREKGGEGCSLDISLFDCYMYPIYIYRRLGADKAELGAPRFLPRTSGRKRDGKVYYVCTKSKWEDFFECFVAAKGKKLMHTGKNRT